MRHNCTLLFRLTCGYSVSFTKFRQSRQRHNENNHQINLQFVELKKIFDVNCDKAYDIRLLQHFFDY